MIKPLTLAIYSQLAYEPLEAVQAALPEARVTLLDRNDSQAYVIETETETTVAFRGTQVSSNFSMADVLRNAKIRLVPWQLGLNSGGLVHRGYKEGVSALADDLAKAIANVKGLLIFTGHSLGGAEATLARCLPPRPDMTMTFGAPKVGNQQFVQYNAHIPLIRYVHARDIAPKHARSWLGYRHGGKLRKLSHSGEVTERKWRWYDELIIPGIGGIVAGTFDHRIGEYVAKLRGAEE